MIRVLFADAEGPPQRGLRELARPKLGHWEERFVGSGAEALEVLGRERFDVLVASSRLAGLDAAGLLGQVKARHPAVARLMIHSSGDREAVSRALPVAQQLLAEPLTPAMLAEVVDRVGGLHTLLSDESMRALVGSLHRLPALPASYNALTEAVARHDVTVDDVARIVEADPALSAKVLQLVNTAWFGAPRRTHSVVAAISWLGIDLITSLSMSAELFNAIDVDGGPRRSRTLAALQPRSVASANLLRRILPIGPASSLGFTAGLLHEIGICVLCFGARERFAAIDEEAVRSGRPLCEVEREQLGVTHGEIGAYLLGAWGLPFEIEEAVAWHHTPERAPHSGNVALLGAVHLVAELIDAATAEQPRPLLERADLALLQRAGLAGRAERIAEDVRRTFAATPLDACA